MLRTESQFMLRASKIRMLLKQLILTVCVLLMAVNQLFPHDTKPIHNKSILVLFSMQPTTPAYRAILAGIRSKLTDEFGDNYNLHTEYLETDRYLKGAYPKEKIDPYNVKYRDVHPDLLICVGIDIVSILKSYAEDYLQNLPTVSIDYDFSNSGTSWNICLNDKTTVIPLINEVGKSLSTILQLFPEADSIYFISGNSFIDQLQHHASMLEISKLKEREKATFITNVSMDDILRRVRHLPANSIVIVTSFNVDSKRVPYYNPESIRLISKSANVPVFGITSMGFGDGAVGGYLLNFDKVGLISGEAAVKILKGANPASIKYSEKDYYEYMFDWRELKRWNILGSDKIPAGSTLFFEEVHFFGKYRWIIFGAMLFLILQTMLIFNLVRLNRKQKIMTLQNIETENKYRELIREDRILRTGELTASLSHELTQPLTSILSNAQAGLRFIGSKNFTPDLLKEILQNIVEDDKRTAAMLSSIRGMMKLEKREKELLNLNMLVGEVVAIFRSEASRHGIKLHVEVPEEPVYVLADATQIQQVILNFAVNAIHSIETTGAENKMIIISESVNSNFVTVSVRDFGSGIDHSIKDKLFKPFVTSKKDGLGIGLSISQSIIQDHQGLILAENKPDGGAQFSFNLKIQQHDL
jgi:signal transduction histidine kinase